ncbi:MAG: hypothetical protein FWE76_03240, partial [Symbiobacteriaceae bacterium]|nr:hypothetical protein [Symbiobacteriaceae bacterium]
MKLSLYHRTLVMMLALCLILTGCSSSNESQKEGQASGDSGSSQPIGLSSQPATSGLAGQSGFASKLSFVDYEEDKKASFTQFLADYKENVDTSGLTPLGLQAVTPTTGPADDWGDTPIPLINPLGSKKLYKQATHRPNGAGGASVTINYLDGFSEISQTIYGERWELVINLAEGGDVLPFLREYAESLGAEFYTMPTAGALAFTIRQGNDYYWCNAYYDEYREAFYLYTVKPLVLELNKEYRITPDMYDKNNEYNFLINLPGEKFTRVLCEMPDGNMTLAVSQTVETDSMKAVMYINNWFYENQYTHYSLYNIPQDPGLYSVRLRGFSNIPSEFSFIFQETEYGLPGYKPGGIGALVVKDIPYGRVRLVTETGVEITNKLTGDYYQDVRSLRPHYGIPVGDDLHFSLPAGYYTLIENTGGSHTARSQLIPVSAGEQTTVFIPYSWQAASKALAPGNDDRELTGSIEISEMIDLTQTAELALVVSDPYERDVYPTKENTVITEGGKQVEIVDIRREVIPCSVALVIDSSGSMEDDMQPTIAAAQKFVESLPDASF